MSPEQREKLSELAKQRHREGKMGMPEHARMGGLARSKKARERRIAKRLAEAAAEEKNAQSIVQVFKDAIHESQPMSTRLRGAQAWVDITQQQAKLEMNEVEQEQKQMSREEALKILEEKLTNGPAAAIIRQKMLDAQNAIHLDDDDVEEIDDDEAA